MSHHTPITAIARIALLAGVLLAILLLPTRVYQPAHAQDARDETFYYAENRTDEVVSYAAIDPEGADITWTVSGGDDAGDFSISDGELTFKSQPDYEAPADGNDQNNYVVELTASDGTHTRTWTLTINVTDVDEAGTVTLSTVQPLEDVALTATLNDLDGQEETESNKNLTSLATTKWQWSRSTSQSGPWTDIKGATGSGNAGRNYRPDKDDLRHYLRATATYTDGHGEGKTQSAVSVKPVVKNLVNDAPVFVYVEGDEIPFEADEDVGDKIPDSDTAVERAVAENSSAGTAVGAPVTAYDEDGDVLTYKLGPAGNNLLFNIDTQTGQISVKAGTTLNTEVSHNAQYSVTVTATDPSGLNDSIGVTIKVTNVEEAPKFTIGSTTKELMERNSTPPDNNYTYSNTVSNYTASDDEDGTAKALTWSLSGDDSSRFELCNNNDTDSDPTTCDYPSDTSSIDNTAVLRFKASPDFEAPTDSGKNNTYQVTVTATDSKGMTASRNVTVTVKNVDETGTVTLSRVQQQVGHSVTATLTDPDGSTSGVTWKWGTSNSITWQNNDQFIAGQTSSSYRPVAADAGDEVKYLFAFASYKDGEGSGKTATSTARSNYTVKTQNTYIRCTRKDSDDNCTATSTSANNGNMTPVFYDQDRSTTGTQNKETTVSVEENTASGNVIAGLLSDGGNPVSDTAQPAVDDKNITGGDHLGRGTNTETVDRLTYTLEGTDRSKFTVDRHTGQLKTKATLDYETKKSYSVTIKATDPSGKNASLKVKINVTDKDEQPVITGGARRIRVPEHTATSTVLSTYKATDEEDDKDNEGLKWSKSGTNANQFNIDEDSGELTFSGDQDFEAVDRTDNEYTLSVSVTVTARDNDNNNDTPNTATLPVTVTVTNVEEAGTVGLSALQPKEGVALRATLSDPDNVATDNNDNRIVTWQWATSTSRSGPWTDIDRNDGKSRHSLTSSYTATTTDVGTYLRATATYTDRHGEGKTQFKVSANPVQSVDYTNTAPEFRYTTGDTLPDNTSVGDKIPDSDTAVERAVAENSSAGTDVGAPVTAYDIGRDGRQETLTYKLGPAGNNLLFNIDTQTGQISVKAGTTLNTEVSHNAQYSVTVTATDPSGLNDSIGVTIKVTNVEEAPKFTIGSTTKELMERNSTPPDNNYTYSNTVSNYTASDDEDGTAKALTWSLSGDDSSRFELCNNNDTDSDPTTCDYPSDTSSIDNTAVLRFKASPDFEAPTDSGKNNTYQVTVTATDSKGMTASRNVTVTVKNVDETGTVTLSRVQQQVGHSVTATLTDPDGSTSGVTWKWGTSNSITWQNNDQFIAGQTSSSYRPVAADAGDEVKYLFAFASYKDGEGSGKTATSTARSNYTVKTQNTYIRCTRKDSDDNCTATSTSANNGNMTPVFYDQDRSTTGTQNKETTVSVEENTASGNVIAGLLSDGGNPVSDTAQPAVDDKNITGGDHLGRGTNTETVDRLTYTLEGTDRSKFTVERHTGQLKTKAALDYENPTDSGRNNTYDVTIKATDPSGKNASLKVKINVTNANEEPVIIKKSLKIQGSGSVDFPEDRTDLGVATYTALGPEGTRRWTLSGDDAGDFSISSAGALSFRSQPNFEVPADADNDNEYEVTLQASVTSDGETLTDDLEVTVTVTNAEEAGTVTLSPTTRPRVRTEITAALTDPDSVTSANTTGSVTTGVTWQWSKATTTNSAYVNISGAGARSASYTPTNDDADYYLRATASYTDGEGSGKSAAATTTQTVLGVDATPNDGTVSLSTAQPRVGSAVTASLSDQDGPPSGLSWQWSWATTATAATSSWTNISGATSASYTPDSGDVGRYLRATASYTDPVDGAGQTAFGTSANAVTTVVAVDEYDRNADGRIDSTEVLEAVSHYFAGTLSQARVLQVVALYFAGLPPTS